MKTIEIKSKDGEVLLAEPIDVEVANLDLFDVMSNDYMVQVQKDGLRLKVINAVNGYGNNCRELFETATVDVY